MSWAGSRAELPERSTNVLEGPSVFAFVVTQLVTQWSLGRPQTEGPTRGLSHPANRSGAPLCHVERTSVTIDGGVIYRLIFRTVSSFGSCSSPPGEGPPKEGTQMITPDEKDQRSGSLLNLALACEMVANLNAATGRDEPGITELVLLVLVLVLVTGREPNDEN